MLEEKYTSSLDWLNTQSEVMENLVKKAAEINSNTENIEGLDQMLQMLKDNFSVLKGTAQEHILPSWKRVNSHGMIVEQALGKALSIFKRPEAPIKILLGGHMDTVYPKNSSFQKVEKVGNTLRGPGVADMKGGLIVMLKALEALERSPFAEKIGWEIFINPDEEVGSPGAEHFLRQAAKRNHLGLFFEPSFPDSALVSSRKGSCNYTVVAHGKSAHAGRDFFEGRNAITALADVVYHLDKMSDVESGTTVNIGYFEGGGPVNIVPKEAICRVNIRTIEPENAIKSEEELRGIIKLVNKREGIKLELYPDTPRPPKKMDKDTQKIFDQLKICGDYLRLPIHWKSSGGVCDGNIVAAVGLPTVDTLGVVGGNLHTHEEYMNIDSLVERSRLVALFLMRLETGWFEKSIL
jgi:glutamate carboxypeptidase